MGKIKIKRGALDEMDGEEARKYFSNAAYG
jgi:hypothetical protein